VLAVSQDGHVLFQFSLTATVTAARHSGFINLTEALLAKSLYTAEGERAVLALVTAVIDGLLTLI